MTGTNRRVAAVALAAGVALAPGGCGSKTATHLAVQDGPVGQGNGITPSSLSVPRNAEVDIEVTNTATKTHGFSITGYDVRQEIPAGQKVHVRFTAVRSGTFRVFCQLHPSHAPAELTVN